MPAFSENDVQTVKFWMLQTIVYNQGNNLHYSSLVVATQLFVA